MTSSTTVPLSPASNECTLPAQRPQHVSVSVRLYAEIVKNAPTLGVCAFIREERDGCAGRRELSGRAARRGEG